MEHQFTETSAPNCSQINRCDNVLSGGWFITYTLTYCITQITYTYTNKLTLNTPPCCADSLSECTRYMHTQQIWASEYYIPMWSLNTSATNQHASITASTFRGQLAKRLWDVAEGMCSQWVTSKVANWRWPIFVHWIWPSFLHSRLMNCFYW